MTSEQSSTTSNFGLTHVIVPPIRVQWLNLAKDGQCSSQDEHRGNRGRSVRVGADLLAVAAGARAAELGAPERALADADPVAIVYTAAARRWPSSRWSPDAEGLRTAAARAVRACRGGGTVAWALDASLPLAVDEQVRALAEGAVLGGYDGRRWAAASGRAVSTAS